MAKRDTSHPAHGEEENPHKGQEHHGWSPDVDEAGQQPNDSAHRSFHPDTYAPDTGTSRKTMEPGEDVPPASPVESTSRRGEEHAEKPDKGTHDTGPKGPSRRPSGTRDASGRTGVDPQDPTSGE
jgi:hypothetical protein